MAVEPKGLEALQAPDVLGFGKDVGLGQVISPKE
jgi:hypothetical protein